MVLLDSHDTPRFRTIVSGDRERHLGAMTMLLTYPGVPSIFMGDEIGLEGTNGDDTRKTMPWHDRNLWDSEFLEEVKKLTKLRRTEDSLINGGLRWVANQPDYIAYLRESAKSSILVLVVRKSCEVDIDLAEFGYSIKKTLYGYAANGSHLKFKANGAISGVWKLA
jgi:alpha-glucosidase